MTECILHPIKLQELAKEWLLEDTSHFDFGGAVTGDYNCEFTIFVKSGGVLAGIPFANAVFSELRLIPQWLCKDGSFLEPVSKVAIVSGSAKKLLLAERVVLNILSRASGVATVTSRMLSKLHDLGWQGVLAATRKTTPGFRMVEKYAVKIGGADIHRYDLSSMVMLKDNHIVICGSVKKAIEKVRLLSGFSLKIEVECNSLQEALDAADAKCDIIMLDNFEPEDLKLTAEKVKSMYPSIMIEASGGITEANVTCYANPFIDILSSSSLVQGYSTLDFSMKVSKQQKINDF